MKKIKKFKQRIQLLHQRPKQKKFKYQFTTQTNYLFYQHINIRDTKWLRRRETQKRKGCQQKTETKTKMQLQTK